MIQILNKHGDTSIDDGLVLILDKNGNVKKIVNNTPIITHEVLIDCGSFLAPTENLLIDCGSFI
jgi:hypothetical protein